MQTFFSLLFLIHYTLASDLGMIRPRAQEDHLADYPGDFPSDDLMAEIPGNQLIISGDITGNNEPGLERQQQPQQPQKTWLKSPEALLLAGGATAQCNNAAESIPERSFTPRRFRRSSGRHAKRQCTVPEPQKLQNGEEAPTKPKTKRPEVGQADSGYPGISLPVVQNIIMQIRMWGSIAQEPHEGVCGPVEVPICVPMLPTREYPTQQQSFSHFVVPVRFWEPEDQCFLAIEDLWCCDTAKQPDYSRLEEMPRYPVLLVQQLLRRDKDGHKPTGRFKFRWDGGYEADGHTPDELLLRVDMEERSRCWVA